ncbi:MAG TPA: hypothetical protein VMI72_15970, partial [Roseiarcus sp.]|nr:hypothetical protein [Roseiarcus sp.]
MRKTDGCIRSVFAPRLEGGPGAEEGDEGLRRNASLERPNPSKIGSGRVRKWSCDGLFPSLSFPVLSLFNGLREIPAEIFFAASALA